MAGFNKMFIMLPVMFAARKLDGEDPMVVYWLRVAYFSVQAIVIALVSFTYIQASAAAKGNTNRTVYVPPPPQPFADPNAKVKYSEVNLGAHITTTARSLLGSTLFGICLTTGLHIYKGMIMGLAIQTVMAPLNLLENALVKALVMGKGIRPEDKVFGEKTADELTADDEVVDAGGNVVVRTNQTKKLKKQSFEEVLLDTWDAGAAADIGPLMQLLNAKNCNFKTKENSWTPLMILCGLGAKGTGSAIRQAIELGADPTFCDAEGWNAMHWAAFHGSAEAARALLDSDKVSKDLYIVKDKEGKTPVEHARAEGNDDVAKLLEDATTPANSKDDGLRKRK